MDILVDWIKDWGYWAVFLGATVEGESVILTASALAAMGYLSIVKVMLVAFFTTVFVDQALFFLGRAYGADLFERFPRFKKPSEKAFQLLHRFDTWFILSFRFIYGIRTISPVVIGAAHISPSRFIPLNIISAAIWATVSCLGGYWLGDIMASFLHSVAEFQKYIFVALLFVLGVGFMWYHRKHQKNNEE